MIRALSRSLDSIRDKVEAGERLSAAEAEMLWDEAVDLHELGELANQVRERKNGNRPLWHLEDRHCQLVFDHLSSDTITVTKWSDTIEVSLNHTILII